MNDQYVRVGGPYVLYRYSSSETPASYLKQSRAISMSNIIQAADVWPYQNCDEIFSFRLTYAKSMFSRKTAVSTNGSGA